MPPERIYDGKRSIDGLVVTVDGRPLAQHYEVQRYTNWGFEWTYEGASRRQLALAILYDHIGDKDRAIRLSEPFMTEIVADLNNDWILRSDEIRRSIAEIEQGEPSARCVANRSRFAADNK
jgi:uncharacterized protein DUF6166